MPQDYEINWREHRPSIKGRHIFGMILDSSSKHHTVNMRLLLVTLACLATSLALPVEKQKRDILPGDPRYGTNEHHHHHHQNHENTVEDARTSNSDYSYSVPAVQVQRTSIQVPLNTYGPPGYQPGKPLNNQYLAQAVDVNQYSTPVPSYGVPEGVQVPQVTNTYNAPSVDVKKTVTTTTLTVPAENTKTINVAPPSTSYGTPLVHHTKTTVDTTSDSHVASAVKSVKTEVHDHQVVDVPASSVNAVEHTPVTQEVTRFTAGVKSTPSVTTTLTKNVVADNLFAQNLPTYQSGVGGFYGLPSYSLSSYLPSVYTNVQPSYNTIHAGFSGFGVDYPFRSLNHEVQLSQSLPFSTQLSHSVPSTYSFPQNVEFPRTTYQVPDTLTRVVEQVQPVQSVHTVHSIPSTKTVESYAPVETLTPVQHVESVHTEGSVNTATPVHQVQSVKVSSPVQPVYAEHTVVKTKTTPVIQTHGQTEVQRGPVGDFFQNLSDNFPSLPSLPSFPSLPSLPSLPSFPSLPNLSGSPTTVATPVESSSPVSVHVSDNRDAVVVENPLLSSDNNLKGNVVQHVTPANEYVQPTDENGGYIY